MFIKNFTTYFDYIDKTLIKRGKRTLAYGQGFGKHIAIDNYYKEHSLRPFKKRFVIWDDNFQREIFKKWDNNLHKWVLDYWA